MTVLVASQVMETAFCSNAQVIRRQVVAPGATLGVLCAAGRAGGSAGSAVKNPVQ